MVGVVLSGKQVAAETRAKLKERVEEIRKNNNGQHFTPGLVIVQVLNPIPHGAGGGL